jgi:hypothetical protein
MGIGGDTVINPRVDDEGADPSFVNVSLDDKNATQEDGDDEDEYDDDDDQDDDDDNDEEARLSDPNSVSTVPAATAKPPQFRPCLVG